MKVVTSLIVLLLVSHWNPAEARGQGEPSSWQELLESRVRVAYRFTHPPSPGECGAAALPAAGYLVTPPHRQPIGRTWLPGTNQSRWEPLRGPAAADTLAVRIVELWCGPRGQSVLVEANGYFVEISADQLARVGPSGEFTPGVLLSAGEGGDAVQVAVREACSGGTCQLILADALVWADEVRLAVAQRQERERVRFAEGERRAEAQAAQRVQAGASVGAQMSAVLSRQLTETYQRLGATPEQANAIMQRRVTPGMTPAMVRAALGEPRETLQETRSTTIWIYPGRQVVIEGGVVTAVR
jgi:hypothetical protein